MENKKAFLNNKIEKYDYMGRMFEVHKILYEYGDFINKSNVLDITIKDGNVYFNFLSNGVQIKMVCIPYDITSVQLTFLEFGSYDLEETKFLLDIVKDNNVVLDIGANLGWYTLHWLKKRKDVTVFSFEPMADIYDKLIQNLVF
jgi:predicted rRNA methylase YqxC with S4 and FtsJ domains